MISKRRLCMLAFALLAVLAAGCDTKDPMYDDPTLNDRYKKPFKSGIPYSEE